MEFHTIFNMLFALAITITFIAAYVINDGIKVNLIIKNYPTEDVKKK